jgi:mRNA interferase HigB
MHIISFRKLREFFEKDQNSKVALQDWYKKATKSEWEDFVDSVGNSRYVFNIKGNHYRIIGLVLFQIKRIYVRWVGTHKDYDKIKNIDKI